MIAPKRIRLDPNVRHVTVSQAHSDNPYLLRYSWYRPGSQTWVHHYVDRLARLAWRVITPVLP